ncbi:MAG: hypothetical protein NZP74_08690, partial [Anaerolineales bacterium]|nr:hypothetical protein [Anaerolineales bacterium]
MSVIRSSVGVAVAVGLGVWVGGGGGVDEGAAVDETVGVGGGVADWQAERASSSAASRKRVRRGMADLP